jgi:MraZ protein
MATFIGEYTCKLDAKGRIMLPAAFKKQMSAANQERFVVKKDIFERCLVLYPMEEWEKQTELLKKKTNPYNREHGMFLRKFFMGMAELVLDSNNRLLIPKRLLEEVGAEKEVVLAGQYGKIEIWSRELYGSVDLGDEAFANMAEKIMKGLADENTE